MARLYSAEEIGAPPTPPAVSSTLTQPSERPHLASRRVRARTRQSRLRGRALRRRARRARGLRARGAHPGGARRAGLRAPRAAPLLLAAAGRVRADDPAATGLAVACAPRIAALPAVRPKLCAQATAAAFFQRFYLSNSLLAHDPRYTMYDVRTHAPRPHRSPELGSAVCTWRARRRRRSCRCASAGPCSRRSPRTPSWQPRSEY